MIYATLLLDSSELASIDLAVHPLFSYIDKENQLIELVKWSNGKSNCWKFESKKEQGEHAVQGTPSDALSEKDGLLKL